MFPLLDFSISDPAGLRRPFAPAEGDLLAIQLGNDLSQQSFHIV